MSSLSDILTAAKNIVTALNGAAQTYINVNGARLQSAISASTLISSVPGRLATISVTTAGSTAGTIYDSNSASVTTAPIYTIPNAVGVVVVNMPVINGVLVVPGTGQVVTVSYS